MDKETQDIIAVAEQLYMRYGIKSVSMDDVARELGISKKTLYKYVANKHELVERTMQCNGEKDMAVLERSAAESSDAIDEYLRNSRYFISEMRKISPSVFYDLKKYYPKIWDQQMVLHAEYFVEDLSRNIERGIREGLYRDDINPKVIARIYAQTVMAIADSSIFPAQKLSIDRIIHQHALYHLNGIVSEAGRERLHDHLNQKEL
ncbi:hypothetical protein CEQ90_18900 [Lewinellaceae bacterium SD302]|nr:hypothetical protein CEQ90_18900 [Lewinellaceae bacterium SD302]